MLYNTCSLITIKECYYAKYRYNKASGGGGNLCSLLGLWGGLRNQIYPLTKVESKEFVSETHTVYTNHTLSLTKRIVAFTLAEVLITLGIIGVIAAMTLPALIHKNQDKVLISAVKKSYATINNALILAQNDFGVIGDNSYLFNTEDDSAVVIQNLQKYFPGSIYCEYIGTKGCSPYYYEVKYATLQLDENNSAVGTLLNMPKLILPDGSAFTLSNNKRPNCYRREVSEVFDEYGRPVIGSDGNPVTEVYETVTCGYIMFDVNGPKKPNQFGRDVYMIYVTKNSTMATNSSMGAKSLNNILTGNDELEYVNYNVGEVYDF